MERSIEEKMDIPFTSIPCPEARAWLDSQPDIRTAWDNCPRGDWLWWALRHLPTQTPPKHISVLYARWNARRAKKKIAAYSTADAEHAVNAAVYAPNDIYAAQAAAYADGGAYADRDDDAFVAEKKEQAKWIRRHIQCPHLTP